MPQGAQGEAIQKSRKQLLLAVAMIAGGVVAFFVLLAVQGIDPDERPLGLAEWMLFGALVAPGFGYLVKWRQAGGSLKRRE